MANSYYTLVPGENYLKNFDLPVEAEADGITAANVTEAENLAYQEIRGRLSRAYGSTAVNAWATGTPPPTIAMLGEMLGAAQLWRMRFGRDGMGDFGMVESLRSHADDIIERILAGQMDVIDANGDVVERA